MTTKILVSGGSGFIGTNMIDFLLTQNVDVVNWDIHAPVNKEQHLYWKNIDLLDAEKLMHSMSVFEPDYIIHLAARTDLAGTSKEEYPINSLGTQNLIEAANNTPSVKRIIFTSSMLVCRLGYTPKHFLDYHPDTPYGESKVQMEKLIYAATIRPEWLIIRPSSIWGPWFKEPYRNFFDMVIRGLFIHPGKKACTKTYGYIGNSVVQIFALLKAKKEDVQGKCFYIGDSPPIAISDWADEIKWSAQGKKNLRFPYFVFRILAIMGDLLKITGVRFPMTSFRLKNMTTNNIIDLEHLFSVVGTPAISRSKGTINTLTWMKQRH